MSNVTLIVIAYGRIKIAQAHWRTIKLLIEHGFDTAWKEEPLESAIDEGYILVDCTRHIALNAQSAFTLSMPEIWEVVHAC